MDYETELQNLKEAQKKKAIADLETQKQQSLSNLQAEEDKIKPTYYQKRDSANVQNQVSAKNFHEYLINSGRQNSGIGAQYEISRRNNLDRNLNDINREEAGAIADINRRKTDVGNEYNNGLAGANAQIEADYITNLLNQRQQQWEREFQEKQFEYQKQQDALNRYYSSVRNYSGGSGDGTKQAKNTVLEYKPGGAYYTQESGNSITYIDKNDASNKMTFAKGFNPFTGSINPDWNEESNFGPYQPDNVNGNKLKKTGRYKLVNGQTQSIWTDGKYEYVWNGRDNEYIANSNPKK